MPAARGGGALACVRPKNAEERRRKESRENSHGHVGRDRGYPDSEAAQAESPRYFFCGAPGSDIGAPRGKKGKFATRIQEPQRLKPRETCGTCGTVETVP